MDLSTGNLSLTKNNKAKKMTFNITITLFSLFANEAKINNFSKNDFEMALENNFNFDGKIYKEIDAVGMNSPLGINLANAFLCFHEQVWFNDCPEDFKPVHYRRYVDDIFLLFRSPEHLEKFTNYLHTKHENIKFTYEKESNNLLPFLDILMSRLENGFKTSVYHKPTFSGVYSNFSSFIYDQYKIGLIFTMLIIFSIVWLLQVSHGSQSFKGKFKKEFPIKLVYNCIKTFSNEKFLHTPVALTVEEKELFIALPYLGKLSLATRTRLQNSINKKSSFLQDQGYF